MSHGNMRFDLYSFCQPVACFPALPNHVRVYHAIEMGTAHVHQGDGQIHPEFDERFHTD